MSDSNAELKRARCVKLMLGHKISPVPKRTSRYQLGLRSFLVLSIVIGAAIGLWVRSLHQEPRFYTLPLSIDGFAIHTMWVRRGDEHEFLYMVAFPHGSRYRGGTSPSPRDWQGEGVHYHPAGILVGEEKTLEEQRRCRYWVYANWDDAGAFRPVVDAPPLIRAEVAGLGQTELWKDHLRPALILESQRFKQYYQEKSKRERG